MVLKRPCNESIYKPTRAVSPPGIAADGRNDSSAAPEGNLPAVLTSFVGRAREVREVGGLLSRARLLTLVGPGGCGKTRLALRVAEDLAGRENPRKAFGGEVWWVGLSSLSDPRLVPNAAASALGVREAPDLTPTEALAAFLGARQALLVMDNCEHLVGACAALADALLRGSPGLTILATSREPLGVAGEVSWPVPPLSLPGPGRPGDAEQERNKEPLVQSESVRLFDERARAASPVFSLTQENASAVAALCASLDGMPLAIELAASRVRALSPEQILERLHDRFRLLGGGRASDGRHETLRAAIDWSYDLLSGKEKALFRRLSVFSGGWTLSAAEGVCAGGEIDEEEVLELLSGLVDKSLVVASQDGSANEMRYRMLRTIRLYASEEIEGSGEAKAVGRCHADFFVSLAEEAEPAMAGPEQVALLERLGREHDNMRAALGWLYGQGEAEPGLRLAAALLRFWWFRGHLAEGRAQLEGLLDLRPAAPVRDEVRAGALYALGILIYRATSYAGNDWIVARSRLEESLAIYRRLGDERRVATVLQELGPVVIEFGGVAAARSLLDESLEIGRRSGHEPDVARSLMYLGVTCLTGGDHPSARAHLTESLEIYRRLDDKFWINACILHLGFVECEEGDHVAARSRFMQMAETAPLAQAPWGASYALEGFARLAALEGQAARALRLGGATAALRQTYGVALGPSQQAAFRRALEPAWQALREEEATAAWEQGRTMTLEEALAFALGKAEKGREGPPKSRLTTREAEVLSLVAEGLSDAEVAEKLFVSPRTVGGHLRGAYRKLGVKSRTAATRKAGELGLI